MKPRLRSLPLLLAALAACESRNAAPAPDLQWSAVQEIGGAEADYGRLARITWTEDGEPRSILLAVYVNGAGPEVWDLSGATYSARDVFVRRSFDGGDTWSAPVDVSNTALLSSTAADHDGDPATPARAYHGDSGKPAVFVQGRSVAIVWEDAHVPGGLQGRVRYAEQGNLEVPYRALVIARSADAGETWSVQRITDGSRDANQSVVRASAHGWVVTWQEDPQGLQPGEAEGPGEGGSGAKVSKGTDIWYTHLPAEGFGNGAPWPEPVRLTDNDGGKTGASRCNTFLFGKALVFAYEETKGNPETFGKYVRYHVLTDFADPATDVTGGEGWILSDPAENARRARILGQGTPAPGSGLRVLFLWRQGRFDQGGPADIFARRGLADPAESGASNGLLPRHLDPAIVSEAADPMLAAGNEPAVNLSSSRGITAASGDDDFEDARAHRGLLRGDFVVLGHAYTPDWALARYTDLENYDFFVLRSFDGGATWTPLRNVTDLADPRTSVREPRIVAPPGADPAAVGIFYVAWSTELNQYDHCSRGTIDLDAYITRTTDHGETYAPAAAFAAAGGADSASQLQSAPDGREVWIVWREVDETGAARILFRCGTSD